MSLLILVVMLSALPGSPIAQSQPDVDAVKFSWRKLPGPNAPSGEKAQQMRIAQLDAMIAIEMRKDPKDQDYGAIARLQEEKQRIRQNSVTIDSFNHSNKAYEYKFKFKNHGKKEVAALLWSYVFTDSTGSVLVRLRFGSNAKISAGKESGLTAYSDSSPPFVVDARGVTNGAKTSWKETVIIEEIEFSDGTRWNRSGS